MIRPLVPDDLERFYAVRTQALTTNPEAFQTTLAEHQQTSMPEIEKRFRGTLADPQAFMLGAFVDDDMVGMMGFQRYHRTTIRHKSIIWGVYIAPTYRGQGLGGEMLDFAIRMARGMDGLQQIQLTVVSSNAAAVHLYQSRGFEQFGYEKAAMMVDNRPIDEIHMQLFLTQE